MIAVPSFELEPTPESFQEFGRWSQSFLDCLRPKEPTRDICLYSIEFLGYDIALTDDIYAAFRAGWHAERKQYERETLMRSTQQALGLPESEF